MLHSTKKPVIVVTLAAALGAVCCGPASSHSVYVAPVHVSGGHTNTAGHGAARGFWGTLFGLNVQTDMAEPGAYGVAMPYGYSDVAMRSAPAPVILSDEARYRAATGLALPPRHDLVVVPPTTPKGDVTWIWSNAGPN